MAKRQFKYINNYLVKREKELLDKSDLLKMLTDEQTGQLKKQIIQQIETSFPEDKKSSAIQQLNSMNNEQLEQFLAQNKLIKNIDQDQQCVFCLIISGKISNYKIDENEDSIAVLEINPISKGHIIIIPKTHSGEVPKKAFDLAQEVSKKISQIFNPKEVEIVESSLFGHKIINVFPVYTNENLHSPKQQAKQEDLEQLQKILTQSKETNKSTEKKLPELKKPKLFTDKNTWLPKRIP